MNSAVTTLNKSILTKKQTVSKTFLSSKAKAILLKLTAVLLVLGILSIGSWQVAKAYEGKILPKVSVNGINLGGKTKIEAENILNGYISELNQNGPQITYQEQVFKPKLEDFGVTFDAKKIIDEAYNYGRTGSLKEKISATSKTVVKSYNISLTPSIDEKKLDTYLSSIATVLEIAPQNATLTINKGQISTVSEKEGLGLDKKKFENDLTTFIKNNSNNNIILVTSNLKPDIFSDGTIEAKTKAENYIKSAPITVTFEDQTFTADNTELGTWVEFNENKDKLEANISDNKLAGFINWIATKIEIGKVDKEVEDGTGTIINAGLDGRGVDTKTLSNQIKERILSGTPGNPIAVLTYVVSKGEKIVYPHAQPNRYTGHYLDINLSEQTLYAFDGTTQANSFLISSGKRGYETPTGEYSVWGKTRAQTMDGPDFYLPNVQWISWFNGEISVHGTYWHNNFGTPMSHGCINASNENAEWVYNFVEEGTPVYVHY